VSEGFAITQGQIPVILHVPHSSRLIPEDIRSAISLTDEELSYELDQMTDSHTDLIAHNAVADLSLKPWIFKNQLSRLVIDPERFPDEREVMNKVGMGAVYIKTSTGKNLRAEDFNPAPLIDKYFKPYAKAFTDLVSQLLLKHKAVLIIDVHSYRLNQHPNAVNHGQARPPICLGTDDFHTPKWLAQLAKDCFSPVGEVIENQPYAGSYVPLDFYGKDQRVLSLMLEARADQFLDEKLQPHAGLVRVVSALSSLISKSKV
jgi:N-formylglutamate amidohydrolase